MLVAKFPRHFTQPTLLVVALTGCFEDPATLETSSASTTESGGSQSSGSDSGETSAQTDTSSSTDTGTTDTVGACEGLGCPCGTAADCDPGLLCSDGECVESICGDAMLNGSEQCDDGNPVDGDGCDTDCTVTEILAITAGGAHTCVLIEGGHVRCWGWNKNGQLGLGHNLNIGDDELPSDVEDVALPAPALQVATGESEFTCALLDDLTVYCWGLNDSGQLGYGDVVSTNQAADNPLTLGGMATELTVGALHACARLDTGSARCWGLGTFGRLGYGNTNTIGDDEVPDMAGNVPVGGSLTAITAGAAHTCGLSTVGRMRCWGRGDQGRLGYGNTNHIGDNEPASMAGDIYATPMGLGLLTKVTQMTAATQHTCALFETGDVHCWGDNTFGQLGRGNTNAIGDDELPASVPAIELPGPAIHVTASGGHTCVLLETREVYCWGGNAFGQLGYGNTTAIGNDELPAVAGPVELGEPVMLIDAGFYHNCVVTQSNQVRCWGNNDAGQLGLGNTTKIGDDELPIAAPPISVL